MEKKPVDIAAVVDESRVGGYQLGVFIICGMLSAFDGFDVQSIGYTAPLVAAAIKAPLSSFGPIFSVSVLGGAIGAFCFGPLADRYGRKWLLVAACLLFSCFTALTIFVESLHQLFVFRFLAGLGLGGATPSFLALGAEYAPRRARSFVVTALYAAFPFGGFLGGLTASYLVPLYGWQSIFVIGGIGPLLISMIVAAWLPDSLRFMLTRDTAHAMMVRVVNRISRHTYRDDVEFVSSDREPVQGSRVRALFVAGRAGRTLILWVPFFTAFMVLLSVTAWTPSLLKSSGFPLSAAALVVAANNLGSVVGTTLSGWLVERFGTFRTLAPGFLAGALALATFGAATVSVPILTLSATLAGFFIGGSSSGLLALTAMLYPSSIRSTAIGWGMGIGRLGQIVGPLVFGALVARHSSVSTIFVAAAIPSLVACFAIVALTAWQEPREPASTSLR